MLRFKKTVYNVNVCNTFCTMSFIHSFTVNLYTERKKKTKENK